MIREEERNIVVTNRFKNVRRSRYRDLDGQYSLFRFIFLRVRCSCRVRFHVDIIRKRIGGFAMDSIVTNEKHLVRHAKRDAKGVFDE